MFENLLSQTVTKNLINDINKGILPSSILFSGPSAAGKLTAALELSRILSCSGPKKGLWTCECQSCIQNKALTYSNILLMGPRECTLEIAAAKDSFVKAYRDNASFLTATRYLFLRSIRKLTMRFSSILMEGDSNINKAAILIEGINENLERIDIPHQLPAFDECVKICEKLLADSIKLESEYLYNSIPINQIRNMQKWAYIKPAEGKKTVIIENADKMQVNVRNALLKTLEEPPADCIFILLTSRRNAVMPTILSRLRNYNFISRNLEEERQVIKRVFHNEYFNGKIEEFLLTYLPVPAAQIREEARKFLKGITSPNIPNVSGVIKNCGDFKPKLELKIFYEEIGSACRNLLNSQVGCEANAELLKILRQSYENVTLYNQSIVSALETLIRDVNKINALHERIITKECVTM